MTTPTAVRSVYAHVPFCHTICGYCDFYSVVLDRSAASPLVDALLAELDHWLDRTTVEAQTIFVGGGTPTTLPPADLARLLGRLRSLRADRRPRDAGPDDDGFEFTVEANPATVAPDVAEALAAAGVTRVSIGAQSFDPSELRVLDRIHHPRQVAQTVHACRAAGIERINLDLIFGVPGQTLDAWLRSLHAALELEPEHLSCYGLTYEPGTPLFDRLARGQVARVDADVEAAMYEATIDALARAGLRQYEISNFARPGRECRHNLAYWHNEPHLGLGPSAAGLVDGVRYRNVPDASAYGGAVREGRSPQVEQERLEPERRARETAMLELRLIDGIDRARFAARFGRDPADLFADALARHVPGGRLACDDGAIRLTRAGLLVADSVIADFL